MQVRVVRVHGIVLLVMVACSTRTLLERRGHRGDDRHNMPDGAHRDNTVLDSERESNAPDTFVSESLPSTQMTGDARDAQVNVSSDVDGGRELGSGDAGLNPGNSEPIDASDDGATEPLPGALVFAAEQVLEVEISMAESDRVELEAHGNLERYLPAAVTINGHALEHFEVAEIGIRHKGAYSLHHCFDDLGMRRYDGECAKLSYKLKFDEYMSGVMFDGLKRLNLHASSNDSTMLREVFAYELFRNFGVDAPRTTFVRLKINGRYLGLFIGVEELDGTYAAAHYPNGPDGNLYKEVWPVKGQADQHFIDALETNELLPEVSDMQAFANAVAYADESTFATTIASWIDLEEVLRYIVVDRAIKNWDGIMAFYSPITPHNFFWYHDTSLEPRFHLIPWDLDNTFWAFDPYMSPQEGYGLMVPAVPDWNTVPANCEPRVVWGFDSGTYVTPPRCDRFLDLLASTQWTRFVELGHQLLGTELSSSVVDTKLQHWQLSMQPLLADDPYLEEEAVAQAQTDFRSLLVDLVADFALYLAQGIELEEVWSDVGPGLRPIPSTEELSTPSYAAPLDIQTVTNFEYIDGVDGMEVPNSSVLYDDASIASVSWNRVNPIADGADARLDFTYNRTEGANSEWLNLMLGTSSVFDLRDYTQIEMTLRADQARSVRVRVYGTVFADEFGDAWPEFGAEFAVDNSPKNIVLPLHELIYPTWARSAWQPGQGWDMNDSEALELVLATFAGIIFVPQPQLDGAGELLQPSDSGYLEIDNVYFR
jgi:hypothetical protein